MTQSWHRSPGSAVAWLLVVLPRTHPYRRAATAMVGAAAIACTIVVTARAGRATPSFIISHHVHLDQAPDAYERFDARERGWTKVVLKPGK